MARPRLPSDVLEMKGAWNHNPNRRRKDAKTEAPLDINSPPPNMSELEIELWRDVIMNAPVRVLKNSDKFLVEVAARTLAVARYDRSLTSAQRNTTFLAAKGMLSLMGMTPADRSRVTSEPGENDEWDPLDEFTVV